MICTQLEKENFPVGSTLAQKIRLRVASKTWRQKICERDKSATLLWRVYSSAGLQQFSCKQRLQHFL